MFDENETKNEAPAEKIESNVAVAEGMKDTGGNLVTDTAGKPIPQPITPAEIMKPQPSKKDIFIQLMKDAGFKFTDPDSIATDLLERAEGEERKQKRNILKLQQEEDTKKLLVVADKVKAFLQKAIAEAGIKMDIPGKQIVYHVGDAGSQCLDIAYPEPLPDKSPKKGKGNGNGGIKVRKAVAMGEVHLRIPELSINGKVAESLSAFYKLWTGKENHGFASATIAAQHIGDGSEGKAGQDGVFKVQNVPAFKSKDKDIMDTDAYNIVTLSDKGYSFFNITKGKVSKAAPKATPPAPVVAATPAPTAIAPATTAVAEAEKPANWNTMSKADKKAWRHQGNQGKAS